MAPMLQSKRLVHFPSDAYDSDNCFYRVPLLYYHTSDGDTIANQNDLNQTLCNFFQVGYKRGYDIDIFRLTVYKFLNDKYHMNQNLYLPCRMPTLCHTILPLNTAIRLAAERESDPEHVLS